MFKAIRKTYYDDIHPLPRHEEVARRVRRGRALLIVSLDSKISLGEVRRFFDGLSQKTHRR